MLGNPRKGLYGRAARVAATNRRLIRVRWVIGFLVAFGSWAARSILGLLLPLVPLLLLGAVILLYNLIFHVAACRVESDLPVCRRMVILQVLLDWAALGLFIHFTGGITSPAVPIFLIHLLVIIMLMPESNPALYMGLVIGLVVLTAVLEWVGVIPHYQILPALPADLHRDPFYVLGQAAFFSTAAGAAVMLVSGIMRRLRMHERQLEGLLDSSRAVSSTLELREVLDQLVESAARALDVRSTSIRLLDSSGENLLMEAWHGLSEEYRTKGKVQVSRSMIDREALSGRTVQIRRIEDDDRLQYPEKIIEEGLHSMVVTPIRGRTGFLGVLRVYSSIVDRFGEEDIEYMEAIAAQGGVAIENAMAHAELKEEEQARSMFVRTVTHELRSPVAGAQSLVRILQAGLAGPIEDKQQDIVGRISRRLDFLQELINDLLALASTSARFHTEPEPVLLEPALSQVIEAIQPVAADKSITLESDEISPEWVVLASDDVLQTVFRNLVGNAVKFTPEGGTVRVEARAELDSIQVQVVDNGIGIPQDEMDNLWEDFFRASNARRKKIGGTGLGLAIVRRMLENVDGRISVQSEEGKGSCFTVTLKRLQQ